MKRGDSGELEGSLQPSEKAAKEGDAVPQPVGADPLFVFLRELKSRGCQRVGLLFLVVGVFGQLTPQGLPGTKAGTAF